MSIAPPGYTHDEPDPGWGSRQADDSVQYELKSVQVLRGRESSARAKWHNQGWDFVSENRSTLRTELNFRRVRPKTFATHLLGIVATLRKSQPKTQSVLAASCALILVAGIVGIVVGTQRGGDSPSRSVAETTASTAPTVEPTASGPNDEQVLTTGNSEEFAALLALPEYCHETIASFAAKYGGRTIAFDGSITDMADHGHYDTRYDILVSPGNKGPDSTIGPYFKFEDVSVFDLNLTGARTPESVGEGDRFHFIAQVVEYNPNACLLFLEPVSTGAR